MKFLTSQLTYLLSQREARRNLGSLLEYLVFLAVYRRRLNPDTRIVSRVTWSST